VQDAGIGRVSARAVGELVERRFDDMRDAHIERARMAERAIAKGARAAGRVVGQHAVSRAIERRPAARVAA
jgi:hypothetical protein